MATQTFNWIIRGQQEGFARAAQEVERETRRITSALSDLESRRVNMAPSAFADVPQNSRRQVDLNDLRAEAREINNVAAAAARLAKARQDRAIAERRINAPFSADFIKDPVKAFDLDVKTKRELNAASAAHIKAIDDEVKALQLAAAAARRRALAGDAAGTFFNEKGAVAYPGKDDLFNRGITDAVKRAQAETLEAERESARVAKAQASARMALFKSDLFAGIRQMGQERRAAEAEIVSAARLEARTRFRNIQLNLAEGVREAGERRRQAAADIEGQRQRGIFDAFSPSYVNPDLTTRVGQGQDKVNLAERALAVATQAQADIRNSANPTSKSLHQAEQAVDRASRALATSRAQLAIQEQRASIQNRSLIGRTRGQFMEGFRGASDRPYAEQIGQAFKFSVFYGTAYKLLFALTATLQATLTEGIAFESAMTELKIASGQSADAARDMAKGLADQATMAGAAPSQGVLLGARSLGLFGATEAAGASLAEQERIATISARVVSRMAVGSKTAPEELQTQIAAVANAFGGGAAGQIRAYDLDAYLGRQFGVAQGSTIQAVAESGTVGQAAGFDQEQVSAIAAYLQSRTGQTPGTVAGWMAQIFSRGGEGSLTALTGKYGIDPNAELSAQIRELAAVYQNASEPERAEIAAGFGRGKVQNAAVVLLEGLDTVMKTAESARTGSVGEGDKIFEMRMGDIGGQIQLTLAAMQAFASELGQSGLLDIIGAGIVVFRELVESVTGLLRAWNELPGALRTAVAALALFTVAARTGAGAGALGALAGVTRAPVPMANAGQRMVGAVGGVGGVPLASAAGIKGAAMGALATAGPWVAATAGLWALGELKNTSDRLAEAQESASQALGTTGLTSESTADDVRARASELSMQANMADEASSGWWNSLKGTLSDPDGLVQTRANADSLNAEADRLQELAKTLETLEIERAAGYEAPVITGFDTDELQTSLDAITDSGGTAGDRLRALRGALLGTADAAKALEDNFDPKEFGARNAGGIFDALMGGDKNFRERLAGTSSASGLIGALANNEGLQGMRFDNVGTDITSQVITDKLGGSTGIAKFLEERGTKLKSLADLDEAEATEIAQALATEAGVAPKKYEKAVERVRDYLLLQSAGVRDLVAGVSLTPKMLTGTIDSMVADAQEAASNLQDNNYGARIRGARGLIRGIMVAIRAAPGGATNRATQQLNLARRALSEVLFEESTALRQAAQQNAKNRAEVAKIGARFLRRDLNQAIRLGNTQVLAEIIGQAGKGAVRIARQIIAEAVATARAARQAFLQMLAVQREVQSVLGAEIEFARGGLSSMPEGNPIADKAKQTLNAIKSMTSAAPDDDVYKLGSDVPGYEPPEEPGAGKKGKSAEDKKADREQARQEMLDLKNNLYLLSIDLSDPLAMAVAAVKDARRRLQSDIGSGQDKGVIAASRVALRQAEIEKEATAFQQRLDQVTTAEELGRISHRKYISYLQNEKRRLESIKNRTFQQQEQLDSIDRLMKDAADSMQGMWNFGDIKLPTPYQVRRQVEQMRVDRATQLDATSRQVASNSTIYIDGADTGKVRQIINETLGKSNATVTNRPRRR